MKKLFGLFAFACLSVMDLSAQSPQELYIDLIKKCVSNVIYEDDPIQYNHYDENLRLNGYDWPKVAHTMIGMKRLNNIHQCMNKIIAANIPGDCMETGVWRGGATILMRAILKAYNITDKKVWVADSFEGLPPPNVALYPADKGLDLYIYKDLAVSVEKVKSNFQKYDLLDDQVVFLKGFFSQSLPTAPVEKLALLRLDGDLYESTMDSLVNLYPKLSVGGFLIIDDYEIEACRKAVTDYRQWHNITDEIIPIDWTGVYWEKTK